MARKATVDRDTVLRLLREGKTSQSIASQYGVSRQAIDLYRKQLKSPGVPAPTVPTALPPQQAEASSPPLPPTADATTLTPQPQVSLDQMIELMIQAFSAMKRLPELEIELKQIREQYETVKAQISNLEEREKRRLEQESRWQAAISNKQ
jgi:hypothetical protein